MTLLGIIGSQELIILLMFTGFMVLLPIIALVDIIRGKFEGSLQLIWVLIVICLNVLGAILYFAIGRNQKIKQKDLISEP